MKRTTIFLDESIEHDLRTLAAARDCAMADVVREAIAEYVGAMKRKPRPLPSWVGMGRSGRHDIAEKHEDYLWDRPHWPPSEDGAASARPKRRAHRTGRNSR